MSERQQIRQPLPPRTTTYNEHKPKSFIEIKKKSTFVPVMMSGHILNETPCFENLLALNLIPDLSFLFFHSKVHPGTKHEGHTR